MKRLLTIAICLSVLYAGAVAAFAGCEALTTVSAGHDHGDASSGHHHGGSAAPRPSDSGKIHCPNLFGAFLVGSQSPLKSERQVIASLVTPSFDWLSVLPPSASRRFDLRPPGLTVSQSRPLHLRLSVIRI